MPKQVDHDARREQLAAALWRLVLREGVEGASLRRVAAEAGWSVGSLRHYFATHAELLAFAMELVASRATARIRALVPTGVAAVDGRRMLEEVLPLDDERRAEMHVWLAFTSLALSEPSLRGRRDEAHTALRGLCRQVVDAIGVAGPELEAERLHALVDGLALHAVLAPQVTTPARQVELLAAHLGRLTAAAAEASG